jgi:hypothetical protein
MTDAICDIFIDPPVAIARLGGSSSPQDAFTWGDELAPRTGEKTSVVPAWTLDVQPDGSVLPRMPETLTFRDGEVIRPVCPFFELWAWVGDPQQSVAQWTAVPLTPSLLQQNGMTTADVVATLELVNAKAARRRNNPDLRFGAFPALKLAADVLTPVPVRGVSPPSAERPMVPRGRSIPMGSLRFIRSVPQPHPGSTAWDTTVNVEILRLRFTPPAGRFYGPPEAALPRQEDGRSAAVPFENAFLDPGAGWFNRPTLGLDDPSDTYDTVNDAELRGASLGVVDDTSDGRLSISLQLSNGKIMTAHATLLVGPPDFVPDRRPFLSLADEINDRMSDGSRSESLDAEATSAWVEDLFERISETVSLMNVDFWRRQHAKTLTAEETGDAIAGDGLDDGRAMGARDRLRNPDLKIGTAVPGNDPLPLSTHARSRHRTLSDLVELEQFVRSHPGRLKSLVRAAFEVGADEGPGNGAQELTTMRMPPFMRNSNAQPLTLSAWQYETLMQWVSLIEASALAPQMAGAPMTKSGTIAATSPPSAPVPVSPAAVRRLEQVLGRMNAVARP